MLIEGETGTGKEVAARAIHYDGERPTSPRWTPAQLNRWGLKLLLVPASS